MCIESKFMIHIRKLNFYYKKDVISKLLYGNVYVNIKYLFL